jgi:hypothetical protein
MTTTISSTFDIITELAAGVTTVNLATSRPMRIVGIYGTGLDTATITVSKVDVTGLVVTQMGVVTVAALVTGLVDAPAVLDVVANRTMLATDTIRVARAAANSTRIVIRCAAADSFALVES